MMKILNLIIVVSTMLLSACVNSECDCAKSEKIPLFNGKNLDGWEIYILNRELNNDPDGVFTVKNGELHISGKEFGGIITKDEFRNFKIVMEFKWTGETFGKRLTRARDSGFLFASNGDYGSCGKVWVNSIEVNIIEGAVGDFIMAVGKDDRFTMTSEINPETGEYKKGGEKIVSTRKSIHRIGRNPNWKDSLNFHDLNGLEKPVGEWNRLECNINEGNAEVFLNGVLVNRLYDFTPRAGRLQIQSEGAGIVFRKIEIEKI